MIPGSRAQLCSALWVAASAVVGALEQLAGVPSLDGLRTEV